MLKKHTLASLLILSAALSGCAHTGKDAKPPESCPQPPQPPPALMTPPDYEQRVRAILLESEPSAMRTSEDSRLTPDRRVRRDCEKQQAGEENQGETAEAPARESADAVQPGGWRCHLRKDCRG